MLSPCPTYSPHTLFVIFSSTYYMLKERFFCINKDCILDDDTSLRAHLDQVPLNYPSETVVQPSSTAHFHYGFPTVEPLSRYSNKLLSSNLKTAIFQPCKRCHTP